jgi:predicted NBD/HSP70 family sugar kinase
VSFERANNATSRADQSTVRRANLGVVLQQIAGGEPRSRARVASETGLTRGTVSSLVGELITLGLLRETGEDERSGRVGRPGQTLELGDRVVAIGLEVNVDYLAVCVEDLTGEVRHEQRVHSDNRRSSASPVLDRLAALARGALDEIEADGLIAVGGAVALPGLVEVPTGTLLRAPNLGWSEIGVADELGDRLPGLPIRADNEANLAALAEHWQGVASDLESFIHVFGEVGVGCGIFVGGELFRGAHGFGGEFGHITVAQDGPLCKCGSNGCLETFVGLEAMARRAGIAVGEGGRSSSVTEQLVQRARAADPAALQSLEEAGRWLGNGLASAVNLFDVEAVVLGGCFGPLAPWLVDGVHDALARRVMSAAWSPCDVRASEFGEGAAVRGAAALTLRSILAEPWIVAERQSRKSEATV